MRSDHIPLLLQHHVQPFIEYAKHHHIQIYRLIEESGLPNDLSDSDNDYLVIEKVENLMAQLQCHLSSTQLVDMCLFASKENALHYLNSLSNKEISFQAAINSFSQLASSAQFQVEYWLSDVWLTRTKTFVNEGWYQLSDTYVICFMVEVVRYFLGDQSWQPSRIQTQSDASDLMEQLYPQNPIDLYLFREKTGVALPAEALGIAQSIAQDDYKTSKTPINTFQMSLGLALKPYLKQGRPSLKQAAAICSMSPKTLQRRLLVESLSYSQFLDEVIFEMAKSELKNTNKRILDISLDLGYQEATHFSRAFKNKVGITPKQYRDAGKEPS